MDRYKPLLQDLPCIYKDSKEARHLQHCAQVTVGQLEMYLGFSSIAAFAALQLGAIDETSGAPGLLRKVYCVDLFY